VQLQCWSAATLTAATAVEAWRIAEPLLTALSLAAAIGCAAAALGARHPVFELRADLATWVTRHAAATGEADDRIVGRAVARHRDAIDGVTDAATGRGRDR
jgi:hypothetical protein